MDRADYEWHYFIGGNCVLSRRKHQGINLAKVAHIEQDHYEAILLRDGSPYKPFPLGVFDTPDEAIAVIEKVLEDVWEK